MNEVLTHDATPVFVTFGGQLDQSGRSPIESLPVAWQPPDAIRTPVFAGGLVIPMRLQSNTWRAIAGSFQYVGDLPRNDDASEGPVTAAVRETVAMHGYHGAISLVQPELIESAAPFFEYSYLARFDSPVFVGHTIVVSLLVKTQKLASK